MIPRLRPWVGWPEIKALLVHRSSGVQEFERQFARTFGTRYAVAFSYGRSALYALIQALGIQGREIVLPAYTCVVVAHAIVKTGNTPVFVDNTLTDYTMDLRHLEQVLSPRTAMVIPTHLYGYPMDSAELDAIVRRRAPEAWVIHDCAHSFGAEVRGSSVTTAGHASLFGLNISKLMTSIFGGVLATSQEDLYAKVVRIRGRIVRPPHPNRSWRSAAYLISAKAALSSIGTRLVDLLESRTALLNRFTRYYREDVIDLPDDFLNGMSSIEAAVGLVQLERYPQIVAEHRRIARAYHSNISSSGEYVKPPLTEGATYSHYPLRTDHREGILRRLHRRGVLASRVIEYSIPDLLPYRVFSRNDTPNATLCSKSMVTLPIYPGLTDDDIHVISKALVP